MLHLRALRFLPVAAFLSVSATLAGCAAETEPEADQTEEELRALTGPEVVGTLAAGETKQVAYSRTPTYRALRMELTANQTVDLWVRSASGGDARAWLLGSTFSTLTSNSDASATDTSAHITRTVKKAGTYYLAFRDEKYKDAQFEVSWDAPAPPPPPPPPNACTTDAQCGGGQAMCFIDRCVTVSEETRRIDTLDAGVSAAYATNGELRVAYKAYTLGSSVSYSFFTGPWSGASGAGSIGSSSGARWSFERNPGLDPELALTYAHYNGDGIGYGSAGGPSLGYHETMGAFAVGRNAAGARFAALVGNKTQTNGNTTCNLYFSSAAPGGVWSEPQIIAPCSSWDLRSLAIHPRRDGSADIVAAREFGGITLYRRQNPIDPWTSTVLVPPTNTQGRSAFSFAHGGDGTTHLVAQTYVFTSDLSYGDYTGTYMELGDEGVRRSIGLGTYPTQVYLPFPTVDLDGAGNVWIQKRPRATFETPSVVRIDGAGNVAERSLGRVSTGSWPHSSLAVSANGELSLVHVADSRNVSLRRFTPAR